MWFYHVAAQHELVKWMPGGMELGAESRWRGLDLKHTYTKSGL